VRRLFYRTLCGNAKCFKTSLFILHILAGVAQKEASAISTRTRDALVAKKARGAQLGAPANLTQAAREKSWVAMTQNAQANLNNRQAAQLAALLRATGATLRAIAEQLNQSGYRTRHGKAFHPMGVQQLLLKPAPNVTGA
jgi:DNA invertase Pin-like site-specific DNA recombinase